jgi:hypothetical protein
MQRRRTNPMEHSSIHYQQIVIGVSNKGGGGGNMQLMALSKGANSQGLQVQSVVARVNFPHEGTQDLISNSRGTVKKAPIVLLQAT